MLTNSILASAETPGDYNRFTEMRGVIHESDIASEGISKVVAVAS